MIVGAHIVIASKDSEADHKFFREVLNLSAVDAGGGYLIFGLPPGEASIHSTEGEVPHHALYFICDDVEAFVSDMKGRNIDCSEIQDTGWGRLVEIKLPSGAPLNIYQARHARP